MQNARQKSPSLAGFFSCATKAEGQSGAECGAKSCKAGYCQPIGAVALPNADQNKREEYEQAGANSAHGVCGIGARPNSQRNQWRKAGCAQGERDSDQRAWIDRLFRQADGEQNHQPNHAQSRRCKSTA